ncbi:unnamed protein product, partial [Nesidiocoris tenuis]
MRHNGIEVKHGAPFLPQTNGAAENAVRTVKQALSAALAESDSTDLDVALHRFLLTYRNTPHATTGVSPAEALLGRQLRSRLDLLRPPATAKRVQKAQENQIALHGGVHPKPDSYDPGSSVYVRNYRSTGDKWLPASVVKNLGPRRRQVFVPSLNRTWVRHVDQIQGDSSPKQVTGMMDAASAPSSPLAISLDQLQPEEVSEVPTTSEENIRRSERERRP